MRRAVGFIVLALLLACGSHEKEPGSAPKAEPGMASKPAQPAPGQPAPQLTQEEKTQRLLDAFVWGDPSKPEGDKAADSEKCTQRAASDPVAQKNALATLKVWGDCMQEAGWTAKE